MSHSVLQIVILIIGAALLALVAMQALMLTVSSVQRLQGQRRQQRLALTLLESQVQAVLVKSARRGEDIAPWNGWRKFAVEKKVMESSDVCSFYLVPHDKKPIPSFKPGQYLTFQLNVPGQAKPVIRCYSLSDGPRKEYFRVSIKRIPAPRDKPECLPGVGSGHFHERIKQGDIVDVKAPGGHFYLDLDATGPVVLIGGGIGITPVMSMLNAMTAAGPLQRETWFFLGVRNRSEHVMKEHLEKMAREHEKLHLQVCYSQPEASDVKGRDYHQSERVSVELFKKLLPSNNYDYYMCGPGPMMSSVVEGLEKWGVPEAQIHYEAFGPASVKKVAAAAAPPPEAAAAGAAAALTVTFAKTGKTVPWSGAASLLELAEAHNVKVDFGCRAGNCGTCVTAVKGGEVHYPTPPGSPPDAGTCLACIGVPKSNLVLDA